MHRTETVHREAHQTAAPPSDDPLPRLVQMVGASAAQLQKPVLIVSVVSLAAGGFVWMVCFGRFIFDSLTSAVACLTALLFLAAPGILLFLLSLSLREITRTPRRFARLRKVRLEAIAVPSIHPAEPEPRKKELAFVRYLRREVWDRVQALGKLRSSVLGIQEDLVQFAASAHHINFLANPLTFMMAAGAGVLTVLLAAGAALVALVTALKIIF